MNQPLCRILYRLIVILSFNAVGLLPINGHDMNKRIAEINFHQMKANGGIFKIWRIDVPAEPGFGGILCSHHPYQSSKLLFLQGVFLKNCFCILFLSFHIFSSLLLVMKFSLKSQDVLVNGIPPSLSIRFNHFRMQKRILNFESWYSVLLFFKVKESGCVVSKRPHLTRNTRLKLP